MTITFVKLLELESVALFKTNTGWVCIFLILLDVVMFLANYDSTSFYWRSFVSSIFSGGKIEDIWARYKELDEESNPREFFLFMYRRLLVSWAMWREAIKSIGFEDRPAINAVETTDVAKNPATAPEIAFCLLSSGQWGSNVSDVPSGHSHSP